MKYDYIIAGAGCAGLSLLFKILQTPELQNKKILLVDRALKNKNDRTWCYWETDNGTFDPIVHHQWKRLAFKTDQFTQDFELKAYTYKMIRGIDFYNYVFDFARQFNTVHFSCEAILDLYADGTKAYLQTETAHYTADYIFNSTSLFLPAIRAKNTLLQHFMGWEIKTETPVFDPKVGTLMDFRIPQHHGTCFAYVLPVSPYKALVEYTVFSSTVLAKVAYQQALQAYIKDYLSAEAYQITSEEYGIIPMSLQNFSPAQQANIINIGTAGGFTKASTGYTFQFIQKHTDSLVQQLKAKRKPSIRASIRDKIFHWYDRTLLEVLLSKRMTGKAIFSTMFKKLAPEKILQFLGNESSLGDELKVMCSLPTHKFLPAGSKQFFRSFST